MNSYPEIIHISFMSFADIPFKAEIDAQELNIDWGDGNCSLYDDYSFILHHFPGEGLFEIHISGKDIKSLNLSRLHLNNLIFQHCPSLEYLDCSVNELHKLDISGCPALEELYANSNNLTEMDFSGQNRLHTVNLAYNQLSKLDLSVCQNLKSLYCNHNYLSEIQLGLLSDFYLLNMENNLMDSNALNDVFGHLPEIQTGGFIYYDRNPGAGLCEPEIFRSKNWQ